MSDPAIAVGALVFVIGLADSLNPTTIAPAMALAVQEEGSRRAAAFTAGVTLVSVVAGALLVAGPGEAIMAALPDPGRLVAEVGEIGLGLVLFALAAAAWVGRHRLARSLSGSESARARGAGARAAFALGAGIMAVELPTAFPYFGALAAVIGSGASLVAQLLLVVVFNLAFVLPLLAIVGLRVAAGERAEQRLAAARGGLARHAGAVLAALLGAGGIALVAVGLGAG